MAGAALEVASELSSAVVMLWLAVAAAAAGAGASAVELIDRREALGLVSAGVGGGALGNSAQGAYFCLRHGALHSCRDSARACNKHTYTGVCVNGTKQDAAQHLWS